MKQIRGEQGLGSNSTHCVYGGLKSAHNVYAQTKETALV